MTTTFPLYLGNLGKYFDIHIQDDEINENFFLKIK